MANNDSKKKGEEQRRRYVVKDKDTLESIAKKQLRDIRLAALIYEINKHMLPLRMEKGKQVGEPRSGTSIWLPADAEIRAFRGRLYSTAPAGSASSSAAARGGASLGASAPASEPAEKSARNREGLQTSSAVAAGLMGTAVAKSQMRQSNIEKLLGPLPTPKIADGSRIRYIVRLSDTIDGVAVKHPALKDIDLWPLLARLNDLSEELDASGRPMAELRRGMVLNIPMPSEIDAFRNGDQDEEEEDRSDEPETLLPAPQPRERHDRFENDTAPMQAMSTQRPSASLPSPSLSSRDLPAANEPTPTPLPPSLFQAYQQGQNTLPLRPIERTVAGAAPAPPTAPGGGLPSSSGPPTLDQLAWPGQQPTAAQQGATHVLPQQPTAAQQGATHVLPQQPTAAQQGATHVLAQQPTAAQQGAPQVLPQQSQPLTQTAQQSASVPALLPVSPAPSTPAPLSVPFPAPHSAPSAASAPTVVSHPLPAQPSGQLPPQSMPQMPAQPTTPIPTPAAGLPQRQIADLPAQAASPSGPAGWQQPPANRGPAINPNLPLSTPEQAPSIPQVHVTQAPVPQSPSQPIGSPPIPLQPLPQQQTQQQAPQPQQPRRQTHVQPQQQQQQQPLPQQLSQPQQSAVPQRPAQPGQSHGSMPAMPTGAGAAPSFSGVQQPQTTGNFPLMAAPTFRPVNRPTAADIMKRAPIVVGDRYMWELDRSVRLVKSAVRWEPNLGVFRAQLEVLYGGTWYPVIFYEVFPQGSVRYEYVAGGKRKSVKMDLPPSAVQELADNDLVNNWEAYCQRFVSQLTGPKS